MSYEIKNKQGRVIALIEDEDISVWSETGDYLTVELSCEGEVFSHSVWDAYDRNLINQYGLKLWGASAGGCWSSGQVVERF